MMTDKLLRSMNHITRYGNLFMFLLLLLTGSAAIYAVTNVIPNHSTAILDWQRVDDPPPAITDHHWTTDDPLYEGWSYTVTFDDPWWKVQETVDGVIEKILEEDDNEYRVFDTENASRLFVEQLVVAHAVAVSESVGNKVPQVWTPDRPAIIHTLPAGRAPTLARLDADEPVQLTGNMSDGWLEVQYLDSVGWVYESRGSIDPDLEYPGLDKFLKRIGY